MFSFFRRQNKSKSKSKNKQPGFTLVNDIQCVPVEKYEINYCRQPPRVVVTQTKNPLPQKKMGSSESTQTKPNLETSPTPPTECIKFNNNVYPNKTTDFQWVPKNFQSSHSVSSTDLDEILKDGDQFGTAPSSPVKENEILNSTSHIPPQHAREAFFKEIQHSCDLIKSDERIAEENAKDDTQKDPIAVKQTENENRTNPDVNENSNINNFQIMFNETSEQGGADDIRFVDSDEEPVTESEPAVHNFCPEEPKVEESKSLSSKTKVDEIFTGIHLSNATIEDEDFEKAKERKHSKVFETDYDGISHSKPSINRIPDITITESSDSEGEENEEFEDEYSGRQYDVDPRYERTYPSILYDITEVEEPFTDSSDFESGSFNDDKRNIVHHESKYEDQIKSLKCEIEGRDTENNELKYTIKDLKRDILNKTWGVDHLQAELASFQAETDGVRNKLLKVEDDLIRYKNKNTELNEELLKSLERESNCKQINELQNEVEKLKSTIRDLQTELDMAISEKHELQKKLIELESQKNEKIKIMQITLDKTLKKAQKLQSRFDVDYEKLRTVNSDREQQLVDDFEWKLREVELNCKRKLEDKDKNSEENIKQMRKQLENEIEHLKEQIRQIEKYKSYEAEVIQLRGLIQEQDRSLRLAMKTTEQLHDNERMLNVEIEELRNSLEKERTHLTTVQAIHSREIAERDQKHSFALDQQENEINAKWEEKMRRESVRFKLEVEKQHREEKHAILDEAKDTTEKLLRGNNKMWDKKLRDSKNKLEVLEEKLAEKEESYHKELLKLQSNSDRDLLELRRKLDKLDLSYQEQMEKEHEQHEQELENLQKEYDKKIQQNEQNCSQQISSTRATLELVKEQLHREAQAQMEGLNKKYMLQLEQQYGRLMKEKKDAIIDLKEKHSNDIADLQNELHDELQKQKSKETDMLVTIHELKSELNAKTCDLTSYKQSHEQLQSKINELQEKLSGLDSLRRENETTLKYRNHQTEQANTLFKMKDFYQNEIGQWQIKAATENNITNEQISEIQKVEDNRNSQSQYLSKSARRKARARQKNQRNGQARPQLTQQFSTSSL